MNDKKQNIYTPFGTAYINQQGYYIIGSRVEGNKGKRLHRLIYENEYGPIPKGYDIHHIDGNKLNNDLDNLVALSRKEHTSLHGEGSNNPRWVGGARVVKAGHKGNKQRYLLKYNDEKIEYSINKDKLLKKAELLNKE